MKGDPRLVQDLLAHDTDEPVPGEHERLIRAGLAAQLGAAPTSTTTSSTPKPDASPAADPSSAANAMTTGGAAASWKLVTVALVGLGAGAAGFALGRATAPAPAPNETREASHEATVNTVAPSPLPSAPAPTSTPSSEPTASASAAPLVVPAPTLKPAGSSAATPESGFDREQSLLERARSALLRHDAPAAEEALAASRREFVHPKHAEEREYLEILVLRERGEADRARERANAFLSAHPNSLFRTRVEAIAKP